MDVTNTENELNLAKSEFDVVQLSRDEELVASFFHSRDIGLRYF